MKLTGWRIVGIVIAVLVLIAGGIGFAISSVASEAWREMNDESTRMLKLADEASRKRPVLRGTVIPGNAIDEYAAAIADLKEPDLLKLLKDGDDAKVATYIDTHPSPLDHLVRGMQSEESRMTRWSVPGIGDTIERTQALGWLAIRQARRLRQEGRCVEAADLLLAAGMMARDVATDSSMIWALIGTMVARPAVDELREVVTLGTLTPDYLRSLDIALETLDGVLPRGGSLALTEELWIRRVFLESKRGNLADFEGLGMSLRYGFSQRLVVAGGIAELSEATKLWEGLERLPWADYGGESKKLTDRFMKSGNPLMQILAKPACDRFQIPIRTVRANLRLIRIACGNTTALDDPFGAKLKRAGPKSWSVGPDGLDGTSDDIVVETKPRNF